MIKHDNTRALHAYWNQLRAGRRAPFRREVDPRAIESLLDCTFILEHLDNRNTRFRLAGTRLCENFGLELRGMSALALWHGDCREKVREVINKVVDEPCVGHVACTVETRDGYLYDAEFLFLPLRSDFGDISRVLGCGYYMQGMGELARPQEPIHHWVDAVNTLPIDVSAADTAAPAAPSPHLKERRKSPSGPSIASGRSMNARLERLGVLQAELQDATNRLRQLRAIEGGRRGGLPIGVDRESVVTRSRDHLRVIK